MSGAQSKVLQTITREASGDLSALQYHAVKLDSSGQVAAAGASAGIGILQNAPDAAGEAAEVAVAGTSLLVVAGNSVNIAIGDPLNTDSDSHGIKADEDKERYLAIALEASTADGDQIEVLLCGPGYLAV